MRTVHHLTTRATGRRIPAALGCSFIAMAVATAAPALAQEARPDAAPAADNTRLGDIVVTARKRSESSLKVPVALTAYSGKDLAARDINTIQDLTNFTPGLTVDNAIGGDARSDRSFQSLTIRGLVESSTSNPTTSVFINGTPVGSADFLQTLTDVDHVEVLKGPQSAYFGRETFAGAINTVAKSAGGTLTADASVNIGSRNTQVVSGNITIPIIGDKFSIRGGVFYNNHDGSYKNAANPSQTLGNQRSQGYHVAITVKPVDNLTIKAFGMVFQDNDGPAATGILIASGAPAGFNQSNCTVSGQPWFCGTLPGLIRSVSPAQNTTISPTVNYANISQAFLNNPGGFIGKNDFVNGFGLKRQAYHADINVQYDIPAIGVALNYLGAFNDNKWSEISDLGNEDTAAGGQYPGTAGFTFAVENAAHDFSHEVRITTDQSKRLRGLLGASYVETRNLGALGVTQYGTNSISNSTSTQSKTSGVFFALAFDLTQQLTLNFDGRYQHDLEIANNAVSGARVASGASNDFLPRVSAQYKFTPDVMAYATFSRGVNPGAFNSSFLTLPAASAAELTSLGLNGNVIVKPEHIDNYEVGVKGRFFDGRATLSADIYYDKWTDQLVLNNYNFAANDPANPFNVVGSPVYNPNNKSTDPVASTSNNAKSTAKGIEVEANLIPVNHVTINMVGAINDTRYDAYICSNCLPYPQVPGVNVAGKHLPNSPLKSGTIGLQYSNRLSFVDDANWFIRGDYIYKDGVYIQATNTVKTQPINLVNFRGGINVRNLSIEGYVTNAFNNRSYVAGFQSFDAGNNFANTTVEVSLPQLRTAGIRLSYKY